MRRTHLASYFGIGQSLSDDVRGNVFESQAIMSKCPKVVTEHLFVEIPEQVERFDADIGAFQLALEQAPKVFESVGVNLPVNIPFRMVNNLVLESLLLKSLIGHERIGVDRASSFDVSADVSLQCVLFAIADYSGANLATTLQDSHDSGFVFGASLSNPALVFVSVHESGSTTDKGFVYLDFAVRAAKFQERAILHCETDSVEHEPCRLLSDAKRATHFIGTNAVLAIGNHPNSDEPLAQRQCRIFEDSSNLYAELFFGMPSLAFPHPASRDEAHIIPATGGALNAIGPAPRNHELEAVVGVGEVNDGLLESLWFGAHGISRCQNSIRNALLSQVYYCPCKC